MLLTKEKKAPEICVGATLFVVRGARKWRRKKAHEKTGHVGAVCFCLAR